MGHLFATFTGPRWPYLRPSLWSTTAVRLKQSLLSVNMLCEKLEAVCYVRL